MKSVNLIPAPLRAAKCRRAHLRRCTIACAVWGALSFGAAAMCHALWGGGTTIEADERLAKAEDDIKRTERAIGIAKRQLDAAQSALRANQEIANQPDWSILLAILAQKVGDEVVLRSCRVRPADARATTLPQGRAAGGQQPPGSSGHAARQAPFVLEAQGMAKSHKAANAFILALEDTRLFSRVTLLDSAREAFLDSEAIAFRVECSLDAPSTAASGTGTDTAAAIAPPARSPRRAVTSTTAGEP